MAWIVLGGALLPLLLLGGYKLFHHPAGTDSGLGKAKIGRGLVGEALRWRVLAKSSMLEDTSGGLCVGHFDADDDEELLLLGKAHSRMYNANGSSSSISLHGAVFMSGLTAWDFDGNGIDEIVPDPLLVTVAGMGTKLDDATSKMIPITPVFALNGRKEIELRGTCSWSRYPLVGDIAGGGYRALMID